MEIKANMTQDCFEYAMSEIKTKVRRGVLAAHHLQRGYKKQMRPGPATRAASNVIAPPGPLPSAAVPRGLAHFSVARPEGSATAVRKHLSNQQESSILRWKLLQEAATPGIRKRVALLNAIRRFTLEKIAESCRFAQDALKGFSGHLTHGLIAICRIRAPPSSQNRIPAVNIL